MSLLSDCSRIVRQNPQPGLATQTPYCLSLVLLTTPRLTEQVAIVERIRCPPDPEPTGTLVAILVFVSRDAKKRLWQADVSEKSQQATMNPLYN